MYNNPKIQLQKRSGFFINLDLPHIALGEIENDPQMPGRHVSACCYADAQLHDLYVSKFKTISVV